MQHFYERLIEERKRLELNQDEMALKADVSKRTYCNYESGDTAPTIIQLELLSKIGVDTNYLITGTKASNNLYAAGGLTSNHVARQEYLSERERILLDNYRASSDEGKRAVEATSAALAQPQKKRGIKM